MMLLNVNMPCIVSSQNLGEGSMNPLVTDYHLLPLVFCHHIRRQCRYV